EEKSIRNEEEASTAFSSTFASESAINQFDTKPDTPLSNELNDVNSPKDSNQTNLSHAASGFFFGKNTDEGFIPSHTNDRDQQQFDSGLENTRATESAQEFKFDMSETNQLSPQLEETIDQKDAASHQDFILDFSSDQSQNTQTASISHDMDFHIDLPEDVNKTSNSFSGTADNEPITQSFDDQLTKLNLTDIKLDLDEDTSQHEKAATHSESVTSEWQEEVATKIDLAKAYLEMDDKEGAKEILEEVLKEGSDEQQMLARTLLDEINTSA
ncbi:MAG TPA: FimV/HubP family polar landmark protein, partial [Nitrosomonas sp.]|nr:FimV/HubP family polar landmark protein [Nitrosomonas sp.]